MRKGGGEGWAEVIFAGSKMIHQIQTCIYIFLAFGFYISFSALLQIVFLILLTLNCCQSGTLA